MTGSFDLAPRENVAINTRAAGAAALLLIPLLLSRLVRTNHLGAILTPIPNMIDVACLLAVTLSVWSAWSAFDRSSKAGKAICIAVAALSLTVAVSYLHAPATPWPGYAILPYLELMLAFAVLSALRPGAGQVQAVLVIAGAMLALSVLLDSQGTFDLGSFGQLAEGFKYRVLRPAGLMASRNYAGEFLAICLPFVMLKPRLWPLLLIESTALGFTRCRTAYLAALLVCTVIAACAPWLKARWCAVALVLLGLLLPNVIPDRLEWRDTDPYEATWSRLADVHSGSGRLRLEQHTESWRAAHSRESLLTGFGMGAYYKAVGAKRPDLAINPYPSSDFLRVWSDTGVLGLAAFFTLFAAAIGSALRQLRARPEWIAALLALLLACLADVPFYRPEMIVIALMLMMTATRWAQTDISGSTLPAGARP